MGTGPLTASRIRGDHEQFILLLHESLPGQGGGRAVDDSVGMVGARQRAMRATRWGLPMVGFWPLQGLHRHPRFS